jgi:hypothetical protein
LWRGGALRWRLETFGLYMPSHPNARPWWRINARALSILARRSPSYARWLEEMAAVRAGGASGWWAKRLGDRYDAWVSSLDTIGGEAGV